MSGLYPGWADAVAGAIKSGDAKQVEAVTGERRQFRFRIDPARLAASARRGGKKGGKQPKGWRNRRDD